MILGVNGWRLQGTQTGVGRYLLNILRHWDDDDRATAVFDRIRLYTSRPVDAAGLPSRIERCVLRPDARLIVWENVRLGPFVHDDLLFCPSYSRPLCTRSRTVVTAHDALPRLYPELFPRSVRLFYNHLYGWSVRNAMLVITDSEAARQDIARGWGVDPSRIRVVYLAADSVFRRLEENERIRAVRRRLVAGDNPFFLFVGKLSGRRSMPLLLRGLAQFKRRTSHPHKLVLVGLNIHNLDIAAMLHELDVAQHVVYPGYVTDEELNVLYNFADALISPSIYETVSLPVMEAQATGAPVICIDTPGMREITGGAAALMPRPEPDALHEAMARVAGEPSLRRDLSERGMAHARNFSWTRTAVETLAVLEEAVQMERRKATP